MSKKLLIIDDNEQDIKIMQRYFKELELEEIFTALKGEEGLDLFKEHKPNIAVIDTNLPGINGFETCQKIKELGDSSTKVIVMTGLVDAIDAGRAKESGADDYCVKTSDCQLLVDAVKKLL